MLRRMTQCGRCNREVELEHRYCPWCAAPQRRKLVEFFRGADADERRALRVSRYLPEERVRVSVWDDSGTARAAVTLDDEEAGRLAEFLAPPRRRSGLLDDLRTLVGR
jgi:hypothetical protein